MSRSKKKEQVPRWALSLVDTTGEIDSITVAWPDLEEFHDRLLRKLPKQHRDKGVRCELDRMFAFMRGKRDLIDSGKIKKVKDPGG